MRFAFADWGQQPSPPSGVDGRRRLSCFGDGVFTAWRASHRTWKSRISCMVPKPSPPFVFVRRGEMGAPEAMKREGKCVKVERGGCAYNWGALPEHAPMMERRSVARCRRGRPDESEDCTPLTRRNPETMHNVHGDSCGTMSECGRSRVSVDVELGFRISACQWQSSLWLSVRVGSGAFRRHLLGRPKLPRMTAWPYA